MHDQTAAIAQAAAQPEAVAPLPLRHDTILGVCQGIGEDFGFSPTWLRLVFAAMLFVQPVWTVVAYLALGLAVSAARLLAPDVRPAMVGEAADPVAAEPADDQGELPLAA